MQGCRGMCKPHLAQPAPRPDQSRGHQDGARGRDDLAISAASDPMPTQRGAMATRTQAQASGSPQLLQETTYRLPLLDCLWRPWPNALTAPTLCPRIPPPLPLPDGQAPAKQSRPRESPGERRRLSSSTHRSGSRESGAARQDAHLEPGHRLPDHRRRR